MIHKLRIRTHFSKTTCIYDILYMAHTLILLFRTFKLESLIIIKSLFSKSIKIVHFDVFYCFNCFMILGGFIFNISVDKVYSIWLTSSHLFVTVGKQHSLTVLLLVQHGGTFQTPATESTTFQLKPTKHT